MKTSAYWFKVSKEILLYGKSTSDIFLTAKIESNTRTCLLIEELVSQITMR